VKQVNLTRIEIAQFRSFVEPVSIDLSTTAGLKFIGGDNKIEPKLGANGAGKSTVFDAVSWCLSERSIKGLRASDLISYGKNRTEVATCWDIDGEQFRIHRGGPPSRVTINENPADQQDIDNLLGLSRARFLNSVLFGQAIPLFIDLPQPARGDLLDEVLDLELWMQAAEKAAARFRERDRELRDLQSVIANLHGQIQGLPNIAALITNERQWEGHRRIRVRELTTQLKSAKTELKEAAPRVEFDASTVDDAKRLLDAQRKRMNVYLEEGGGLRAKKEHIEQQLETVTDNAECPACGQDITDDFAEKHREHLLKELKLAIDALDQWADKLTRARQRERALEADWRAAERQLESQRLDRALAEAKVKSKQSEIENLEGQIESATAEINPYSQMRANAMANKQRLDFELADKQGEYEAKVTELAGLNYWRDGFKKVRLFCLDNVLQELEVETRNSLLALGLIDWKIDFKTATETKSGTIKLGVQVNVKPPKHKATKFDVLSGGEGQRARLAISLGLSGLIQRWSGVRYMVEVWDEPTAWLSEQGVEDLLDIFKYRADSTGKSIYVCDHRALMHSSFSEIFTVIKDSNGSRIEKCMG
jgi:DNA repair exonuclease SbcCD ATPase subunit